MRHTKIIATVGPASDSDPILDALIAAGTDVFRLNFSHGTHETQAATFARVRAASRRAGCDVAIPQDLGAWASKCRSNASRVRRSTSHASRDCAASRSSSPRRCSSR